MSDQQLSEANIIFIKSYAQESLQIYRKAAKRANRLMEDEDIIFPQAIEDLRKAAEAARAAKFVLNIISRPNDPWYNSHQKFIAAIQQQAQTEAGNGNSQAAFVFLTILQIMSFNEK